MSTSDPRIVAITTDAALVIGLTFAARDWDVASQPELQDGEDADVVVLDPPSVADGVAAVERYGLQRVVLLAPGEAEGALPAGVIVLPRPYTMDELIGSIDHLLAPERTQRPVRWTPAVAPDAEDDAGETGDPPPPPPTPAPGESLDAEGSETAPQDAEGPVEPPAAELPVNAEETQRRPLVARLVGRLFPPQDGTDAPEEELAAPPAAEDEPADAPPDEPVPELDEPVADFDEPVLELDEPLPEIDGPVEDARDDTVEDAPEPRVIQRQPAPSAPAAATPGPIRRTRWRARRQRELTGSEQAFRERLGRVLAATSELERLVEEVPLLEDLTALSAAVVKEIARELDADSVGLWRPGPNGWQVRASRGFSPHQRRVIVPFDQPLFAEVHASGGSMLIDPVESVQSAVAGIGGAHTQSFMAAAIAAGPGRYGIIAVGRNQPLGEADLDLLGGLVLDMAPGIAVAEQLERLRARGPAAAAEPAVPAAAPGTTTIRLPDDAPTHVS